MNFIRNIADCKIIQNCLLQRGYEVSLYECQIMWCEASTKKSKGKDTWEMIPAFGVFEILMEYSITFKTQCNGTYAVPTREDVS